MSTPSNPLSNPRPTVPVGPSLTEYENATGDEKIGVNFGENSHALIKLGLAAVAIIGGLVLGFGFLFRSADKPMQDGRTSAIQEQTAVMREAVQMAREAQEMSRQHMAEMQRAMQEEMQYAEAAVDSAESSTDE